MLPTPKSAFLGLGRPKSQAGSPTKMLSEAVQEPSLRKIKIMIYVCFNWFSNQNKFWNMLQAAFDHEESFFDTPKALKA